MINEKDLANLKNLKALMTQKVTFSNLNHIDISAAYSSIKWLSELEDKLLDSRDIELENQDLKDEIKRLEEALADIKSDKEEPPKKRTRRTKE